MKILYINVIEQNADWGAETFLNKGIESLGHVTTNLDYRKHRRSLAIKLNKISDFDVLFLQRGDRFPPHLLKICNRPKFFWATELVSRNRDQDILLKSNQFDHIFVHSNDCKKRVINNNWVDEKNISVMLNGFDEELHKRITADKDIDILFVGSILDRREKILKKLSAHYNVEIYKAYGKEMSELFNRAKIVLNIHAEEFLDTETRMYEALGCGAFIISEKLSSENPFIPNKHYIEVETFDDMKNKIDYYLNNPLECDKIAQAGYLEAINNHTYQHRAQELIEHFNKYNNQSNQPAFNSKKMIYYSVIEKIINKLKK